MLRESFYVGDGRDSGLASSCLAPSSNGLGASPNKSVAELGWLVRVNVPAPLEPEDPVLGLWVWVKGGLVEDLYGCQVYDLSPMVIMLRDFVGDRSE